jgi:DNA-binding CsgD family transcriptional regulator
VGDLLAGVDLETLDGLPAPQRRVLRVALLLEEPAGDAPQDPRALAVAFLTTIRELARSSPVLIAVDDTQWVDKASAAVLAFTSRRVSTEPVRLLLARRIEPGTSPEVLRSLAAERTEIGPLCERDLVAMVRERIRRPLAPALLHAVHERSGGNPFYALELARALERAPRPLVGEDLPLPPSLHDLVRDRLAALPAETRDILLAAALLGDPRLDVLARAGDADALEPAFAEEVVRIEDHRVRFTHPLLAAGARADASALARRRMHARLGAAVVGPAQRALHLARAADGPDEAVARDLDAVAVAAEARGDLYASAEMSELAVRLTPAGRPELVARQLRAGWAHALTARTGSARRLAAAALDAAQAGTEQADALHLMAFVAPDYDDALRLLDRAMAQAGDDLGRLATIRGERITALFVTRGVAAAAEEARAVAELAERLDDAAQLAYALSELGFMVRSSGEPPGDMLDRAVAIAPDAMAGMVDRAPALNRALCLVRDDRLDEARPVLEAVGADARERGDELTFASALYHLGDLECRAGRYAVAAEHARDALGIFDAEEEPQDRSASLYVLTWAEAFMGRVDEARAHAREGIALSHAANDEIFWRQIEGALGFLELSLGNLAEADRHLRPLWPALVAMGFGDPAAWPVLPNEIEALVGLGELDTAETFLRELEERGRALDSPWALSQAARCRGLLMAAQGRLDDALPCFDAALDVHRRMPGAFERARTFLAQGRTLRRMKRRREARAALEAARAVFEDLGTPLWTEQTREALARIGGRGPAGDALTPTEQRVAALVAEGHSNREAAAELFVSVRTVEANLTRIYAKLGVRSRAELARRGAVPEAGAPRQRSP